MTTTADFEALEAPVDEGIKTTSAWRQAREWATKNFRGLITGAGMAALGTTTAIALLDDHANARRTLDLSRTVQIMLTKQKINSERVAELSSSLQDLMQTVDADSKLIAGLTSTLHVVMQTTDTNSSRINDLAATTSSLSQAANMSAMVKDVGPAVFKVSVYDSKGRFGSGSAFLIKSTGDHGYIVTDLHVASEQDSKIYLVRNDGASIQPDLTGSDPKTDLTVLQVPGDFIKGITPLTWGENPQAGDQVIEIGGPFGFQNTITRGIVSNIHRQISEDNIPLVDYIQTDAATNPGNSGGPLFNTSQNVIGVVESIYTHPTPANFPVGPGVFMRVPVSIPSAGLAFAIPADIARKVTNDIIAYGEVQPGLPSFAFEDNVPPDDSIKDKLAPPPVSDGARITTIDATTGADAASPQKGDIVVGFDDKKIASEHELTRAFYLTHPGERHALSIRRSGETATISLTTNGKPLPIMAGPPRPKKLAQVAADSSPVH